MKKTIVLTAVLFLVACGSNTDVVTVKGERGDSGAAGLNGSVGQSGNNGHSIVSQANTNPSFCSGVGGTEVLLAVDTNDNLLFDSTDTIQSQYITCNGQRGSVGATGAAGTSCTVTKSGSVSTIKCGSATVSVNDGVNGTNGQNASGIYITELLNPCGINGSHDEILLRLSNGKVLALYDGGANLDRFALLVPGTQYRTTDSNNNYCTFQINSSGQLINQQLNGQDCD